MLPFAVSKTQTLNHMKTQTLNRILSVAVTLLFSLSSFSQWGLYGNYINGYERIGTNNAKNLDFITNSTKRMSITSQGQIGIGTRYPQARQEINYTPPYGQKENGLIVTLNKSSYSSMFNYNSSGYYSGVVDLDDPNQDQTSTITPISFLTGNTTSISRPLFDINHAPLFWLRDQSQPNYFSYTSGYRYDTKMIITPQGNCGINIAKPRVALDVRGSQIANLPTAIFGVRVASTSKREPNTGLTEYYTRHIQLVPQLNENGYNQIVKRNDQGMFFTDGLGADGANASGAFVLAPWSAGGNPAIGGMRMDAQGNTEFHGTLRATKVNVDAKWWSDFVFADDYKLPCLADVEAFITVNKHLPNVPSEAEVLENGLDLANMQAIQQQKIEELTLYTIDQEKRIAAQQKKLEELEALIGELLNK